MENDGIWRNLPEDFPSDPEPKDNNEYVITLRFPRFNDTLFYDPIFDDIDEMPATDGGGDISRGGWTTCASVVPLGLGLLVLAVASKLTQ